MKRAWIASAALLAILAAALWHSFHVASLTGRLTSCLVEAQTQAEAGQWDRALELTESAHREWSAHDSYLHLFLHHTEVDSIDVVFREAEELIKCRESGEYSAANARLIVELELLAEAERLTLENVL